MKDATFSSARLLELYDRISDAEDAIPRLRRFVLDLAVRGKLVEQDASDEPAAELLKRIAQEEARLVEKGKIKNRPSLPKVSDMDAPFTIPDTWDWTRFGSIADFSAGRTPARNESAFWNTGDHCWVSIADMSDGQTLTETKETVSEVSRQQVFKSEPEEPGTMIMSFKLTIGKIARLGVPAFHNEKIISIRPHLPALDPLLFKVLPDLARGGDTKGAIKGATLNRESLSNILIPLPPLAEQHRIVAKVEELMALCDQLDQARAGREAVRDRLTTASLARLTAPDTDAGAFQSHARFALQSLPTLTARPDQIKTLRQTILNLAVRGKLVQQDASDEPATELLTRIREWQKASISQKKIRAPRKPLAKVGEDDQPYPLPAGWAFARLGEIIYIQSGDGLTAANMKDGPYPVFGGNGINGHHDCHNVQKPTLVIGRVGYYCGSVHVTPENAWVTDNAFITHFSEDEIFLSFLVLLLNGTNLKEDENATAQPVISGSKIYPIVVGLPPLAEQHRIVAKVDALMALCDQLEASLTTATNTRSKLLNALLHEALEPAADELEAAE